MNPTGQGMAPGVAPASPGTRAQCLNVLVSLSPWGGCEGFTRSDELSFQSRVWQTVMTQ